MADYMFILWAQVLLMIIDYNADIIGITIEGKAKI